MPKHYLRSNDETPEIMPPSTPLSLRAEWLKTQQSMHGKTLTENELRVWTEFLDCFADREIEYAFSNWTRNGKFFPKPADIRELIEAYRESNRPTFHLESPRHTGFGKVQVLALWELVNRRYDKLTGRRPLKRGDHSKYVPLTDEEITAMCQKVAGGKIE